MREQSDGLMVNFYEGFFYICETNMNEQLFQKEIIYKKAAHLRRSCSASPSLNAKIHG